MTITPAELVAMRTRYGLTQTQMAEAAGMTLRNYQQLEGGEVKIRRVHTLAFAHIGLQLAVENSNPDIATGDAQTLAVAFARLSQRS